MAKKVSAAWAPPANAQPVELAEFHKFQTVGEVVIGRIERVTSRPDPNHAEKVMRGLVMSPVVCIDTRGNRQAYRNLAIGLSAHLGLLIGDPAQQKGQAFAFVYDGTRASGAGKAASHQFNVYRLSVQEFAEEVRKTDPKNADLLLSGERAAQDELFPGDDD